MSLKTTVSSLALAGTLLAGAGTASASELNEGSIVDYLKSQNQDSSFTTRSQLAESHKIYNYTGSEEQNVKLLGILRGSSYVPQTYSKPVNNVQPKQPVNNAQPKQSAKTYQAKQPVKNVQPKQPVTQGRNLTVTATAYTAYCAGCSGKTATGQNLRANPNQKVIAVDPRVIPLGSRVYVEGYGEALAGDTGGGIKGNHIDVFIPSKQAAANWGVRTVNITILN